MRIAPVWLRIPVEIIGIVNIPVAVQRLGSGLYLSCPRPRPSVCASIADQPILVLSVSGKSVAVLIHSAAFPEPGKLVIRPAVFIIRVITASECPRRVVACFSIVSVIMILCFIQRFLLRAHLPFLAVVFKGCYGACRVFCPFRCPAFSSVKCPAVH